MNRAAAYLNRKAGRQKLKNYLLELYESTIDGIVIADQKTGRIEYANPAFLEALGWSEKEITSRPFIDFVIDEDKEKTRNASKQLSNRPTILFENRYKTKDGKHRTVKWRTIVKHGKYICTTEII